MPYITSWRRAQTIAIGPTDTGELNYAISCLLRDYCGRKGLSYAIINDCLGAIEGAKFEFVRRVVTPYEDAAIQRNGDVY